MTASPEALADKLPLAVVVEMLHKADYCHSAGTTDDCTGQCQRTAAFLAQMWPDAYDGPDDHA